MFLEHFDFENALITINQETPSRTRGIPGKISESVISAMLSLTDSYVGMILLINLILLFLGVFLETQAIILLATPILLPIAAKIGLDPLILDIIMIINTSIGMITPPMAVNIFVAQSLMREHGVKLEHITRHILPFFLAEPAVLMLISYVPDISTWLVRMVK
ncbi:MAG: TRAP transporter large permease subunit [Deltaproteobacteria bacterium]|nr:TRAP transporter large permease subunit [Deltaproteobacteria bacterium]